MKKLKTEIVVPVLLLMVGIGWLLSSLGIMPDVVFAWPLGLAAAGGLTLALQGVNKGSIVIGPFLIVAAVMSLLRQMDKLEWKVELPCLVIALGALLILANVANVPSGLDQGGRSKGND